MLGLPELNRDPEGRYREHAAPLHSRSGRGPRRLSADRERAGPPPAPLILAIDTAGSACAAAVAAGEAVRAIRHAAMLHGQAEALLPMVDAAMREAGLAPPALDLVAVTTGPGSFTGIRLGLAAARGIALAADRPLLGITSLAAVAAAVQPAAPPGCRVLVALESRRAEIYFQLFDRRGEALAAPAAALPEALAEAVDALATGPLALAGDAAARAAAALADRGGVVGVEPQTPAVVGLARAALRQWRRGMRGGGVGPVYLRPPDVTAAVGRGAAGGR